MRPKTFLFPGVIDGWRADVPINDKMVWFACQNAARAAGIEKAHLPALPEGRLGHTTPPFRVHSF
jgi:hypothetical protein